MNKHLLFLMLIPVLGLASCNGGGSAEFKKLSYLEVGGNVYHSEDGDLSSYYHVASYRLTDEDYAEAKAHCAPGVSLPQTFSLCSSCGVYYPLNGERPKYEFPETKVMHFTGVYNKMCTMKLVENSEATYISYSEYYYSAATRQFKIIEHDNVKTADSKGSHDSAYILLIGNYFNVSVEGENELIEKYNANYMVLNFNELTIERLTFIGKTDQIIYSYEEGNK